jgi:hypothetical protein
MSRIAVLGWGSLIWNPRYLALAGDWHEDGPTLPIEFARISSGNRLTLVIHPGADPVTTLWAMMSAWDLGEARENLRIREGRPPMEGIGWVCRNDSAFGPSEYEYADVVREWLLTKDIDCVVWTALLCNFKEKLCREFTVEGALAHLRKLEGPERDKAEEYVRKTPNQVQTKVRQAAQKELGWYPVVAQH